MKNRTVKLKRKVKPEDLTNQDIDLLRHASYLAGKEFVCFGNSYFKLRALDLITDDNVITYLGEGLLKHLSMA